MGPNLVSTRLLWPEAVFHVLAHVAPPRALPSSLYSARYVRWAERLLGPSRTRELADDAAALGALLLAHPPLAQVQALAWLFASPEAALACAGRPLADLAAAEVARPALLAPLRAAGDAAELLFCAACLELPRLAALPAPALHPDLAAGLAEVTPAAPRLGRMRIGGVRPLGYCGRVFGDEIWLGTPLDDGAPDAEHGAMQAAHEATVAEVGTRARGTDERDIERVAIVRLAERCHARGLSQVHARWYASLTAPPSPSRDHLPAVLLGLLD